MARKQIIWGVAGVVAVAAIGGYSFVWKQTADNAKAQLAQAIEKFNADKENLAKLSYESLETGGYPFTIDLTISKAVLEANLSIDRAAEFLSEDDAAANTDINKLAFRFDDNILISGPLFTRSVLFGHEGPVHIEGWNNESKIAHVTINVANAAGCEIKAHDYHLFNQDNNLFTDEESENWAEELSGMQCSYDDMVITSPDGKTIAQAEQLLIAFENHTRVKDVFDAEVKFNLQNLLFPEGSSAAISELYAAMGYEDTSNYGDLYTQSGHINANMDLTVKGSDTKMLINLSQLRYTDDVTEMNMSMLLDNTQSDKQEIKAEFTSTFKPNYDKLMIAAMRATLFEAADNPLLMMLAPGVSQYMVTMPAAQRDIFLQDVLPSYERLGKLVVAVDASFPTPAAPAEAPAEEGAAPTAPQPGQVDVRRMEISTDLGGLTLQGKGSTSPYIPIPEAAQATLTCLKCTTIIDELIAYQNDLLPHITTAAPETAQEIRNNLPPTEVVAAFKSFLQSAAKDPAAQNLQYDVTMQGPEITINGKPAEELTIAFINDVASKMPTPAPQAESNATPAEPAPAQ